MLLDTEETVRHPTPILKPHIQYSMHWDMWHCHDGKCIGWGRTAKLAYKDWLFETEQQ